MSDLDALERLAHQSAPTVNLPDFAEIEATARRRRGVRRAGSAIAALAVAAVVAGGLHAVLASDSSTPVRPVSPTPTGTPHRPTPTTTQHAVSPGQFTAAQIVRSKRAELDSLAVAPDDPAVRATLWSLCYGMGCSHYASAVAVTDDGFAGHTAYLRVAGLSDLEWTGHGSFVVTLRDGRPALVTKSGRVTALRVSGAASPLRPGETLFAARSSAYDAVDASAGTAHPIPLPSEAEEGELQLQQRGEVLWGFAGGDTTLVSSPDGGATWRTPIPLSKDFLYEPVESGNPHMLAYADLGDDATIIGSVIHRSTDGGASWQTVRWRSLGPAEASWMAVTPSGGLLLYVNARDAPGSTDPISNNGLYASDGSNWGRLHRVRAEPQANGLLLDATTDSAGRLTLYLRHWRGWVSTDEGRSVSPTPLR